jgi:hypothetical protein
MAAQAALLEKRALAVPGAVAIGNLVRVVFTFEYRLAFWILLIIPESMAVPPDEKRDTRQYALVSAVR